MQIEQGNMMNKDVKGAGASDPARRGSGNRGAVSGGQIGVIAMFAVLAIVVVVVIIFIARDVGKESEDNTGTVSTQASTKTTEKATENKTEKKTEAETTEAPVTEAPTTEEQLPDGTKTEMPTKCGDGYVLDGQIFSVACAGHSTADYYADMVNTVASKLPNKVTLYDIVAPTAFGACLSVDIQNEMAGNNQPEIISYINSKITAPNAVGVDAVSNIIKHNAEYIYFNSDHHWTVNGAYYAYEAWCKAKGIKAQKPDDFFTTYRFEGFLGSFYSLAGYPSFLEQNRDVVEAYVPNGTNELKFIDQDGVQYDWKVIYDVTDWARTSKYNCFIGGDNPYTEIENPNIKDGSACILIKESYGNAFAPFLVDHYSHVYVIDYRYYTGSLLSFINTYKVKDVIILNNMEAIGGGRADQINELFR